MLFTEFDQVNQNTHDTDVAVVERAIIATVVVAQSKSDLKLAKESLAELVELCKTAGVEVVGEVMQRLSQVDRATILGSGKIAEIVELASTMNANMLIVDTELTGSQMRNLVDQTQLKVIDRTTVILDIFARHATTAEGKLQVEIAQLQSNQSRLVGLGASLSRLGGGIGTRGPGESKLELDRRHLSSRIHFLKKELQELEQRRQRTRQKRIQSETFTVALCGYTNAGKSSLLNALCAATVFAEDKLFATLDPTIRRLDDVESKATLLLCDTVGFIRNLPHHLVEVFHSTLAEIEEASAILVVVDIADEALQSHLKVVAAELERLNVMGKPLVYAFNKIDAIDTESVEQIMSQARNLVPTQAKVCLISAKQEVGLLQLKQTLFATMRQDERVATIRLPLGESSLLAFLHEKGRVFAKTYEDDYIVIQVSLPTRYWYKFEPWLD